MDTSTEVALGAAAIAGVLGYYWISQGGEDGDTLKEIGNDIKEFGESMVSGPDPFLGLPKEHFDPDSCTGYVAPTIFDIIDPFLFPARADALDIRIEACKLAKMEVIKFRSDLAAFTRAAREQFEQIRNTFKNMGMGYEPVEAARAFVMEMEMYEKKLPGLLVDMGGVEVDAFRSLKLEAQRLYSDVQTEAAKTKAWIEEFSKKAYGASLEEKIKLRNRLGNHPFPGTEAIVSYLDEAISYGAKRYSDRALNGLSNMDLIPKPLRDMIHEALAESDLQGRLIMLLAARSEMDQLAKDFSPAQAERFLRPLHAIADYYIAETRRAIAEKPDHTGQSDFDYAVAYIQGKLRGHPEATPDERSFILSKALRGHHFTQREQKILDMAAHLNYD